MTRQVKDVLERAHADLGDFEEALRGHLKNQNLPDIIASARAKLSQAAEHADAETELDDIKPKEPPLPFGGGANAHGLGPDKGGQ